MKCPVCRAIYQSSHQSGQVSQTCRRCGADLAALIQLHDRALWHYRAAIADCNAAAYQEAQHHMQQALALESNYAAFHAFAGQLWALQGKWQPAIAAWKHAQRLDPNAPIAVPCLKLLAMAQLDESDC